MRGEGVRVGTNACGACTERTGATRRGDWGCVVRFWPRGTSAQRWKDHARRPRRTGDEIRATTRERVHLRRPDIGGDGQTITRQRTRDWGREHGERGAHGPRFEKGRWGIASLGRTGGGGLKGVPASSSGRCRTHDHCQGRCASPTPEAVPRQPLAGVNSRRPPRLFLSTVILSIGFGKPFFVHSI